MTRWAAILEDDPRALKLREDRHEAHFEYLASHRGRIVIAGGLRSAPDIPHCGGLWAMDVQSRDEAVRLCEDDPYFTLGLRNGYRLFVWGKAPVYEDVAL